jgi:hypothetical protein
MSELVLYANNTVILANSVAYYANGSQRNDDKVYTSTTHNDEVYTSTTFNDVAYTSTTQDRIEY